MTRLFNTRSCSIYAGYLCTLNDLYKFSLMFLMDKILIKESFFFKFKNAQKMFKLVQRV